MIKFDDDLLKCIYRAHKERLPFLIAKSIDPRAFELSGEDVDFLLTSIAKLDRSSIDINGGSTSLRATIAASALWDGSEIAEALRGGSTVRLNRVHLHRRSISWFCDAIAEYFRAVISANLYVTSTEGAGTANHFDLHDVIILQVSGVKQWEIWDKYYLGSKTPAKYSFENNRRRSTIEKQELYQSGAPSFDASLAPGDILYVPAGIQHRTKVIQSRSVSITFMIKPVVWMDIFLEIVLKQAEAGDVFWYQTFDPEDSMARADFFQRLASMHEGVKNDILGSHVEKSLLRRKQET